MTLRVQCQNCAARLGTTAEQLAVRVECPRCHTTLLVPDKTAPGATTTDGLRRAEEAAVDFHARRKVAEAEVDMTPMVDVTFLLLIFFMVTAVFSSQKSFQIPTPKEERASTVATLDDYQDDPDPPYTYLKSRYMASGQRGYATQRRFDAKLHGLGLFDFSEFGPSPGQFRLGLIRAGLVMKGRKLERVAGRG